MEPTSVSLPKLALFALFSYSLTFITIVIGITSQFLCWLLFDSFGRHENRSQRKLKWIKTKNPDEHYAIIIGTGFSGLGTATKLNRIGMDDYILLERHGHVGGTWYANKYPGCACDVPSNLYSFSFEPNPKWSHFFSRQGEIAEYLEHCADKYDIRRHIRFHTTVTQLTWIENEKLWQVTIESKNEKKNLFARFVIAATGPLSCPAFPKDIPGLEKYQGKICHTGKWDDSIDFTKKRVAVIGTGASAIQVVPEIQKMDIEELLVFQRTPPWIIPRFDRKISNFEKCIFSYFPSLQRLIRRIVYWSRETVVLSFAYRWPLRTVNEELVKHNLSKEVKDPELRKKVTPTWDLGCKRVLVSSDWYPTLQKPNVKLVTDRVQEIKPNSIVTCNGDEYPVDVIICSTGFETQKFALPMKGINGCSLAEQWSEIAQAYRGITVPNFPNLFMLLGPNSRLGHSSVITMLEAQLQYMTEALLYMGEKNLRLFSVKQSVHNAFNAWLQSKLKKSVWNLGGCHSWYQNEKGIVTTIWPDFTWLYRSLMAKFDPENYILEK